MKVAPIFACLFVYLLYLSVSSKAHSNDNRQHHGYNRKKEGERASINDGIGILLTAGAALGAKNISQKNRK